MRYSILTTLFTASITLLLLAHYFNISLWTLFFQPVVGGFSAGWISLGGGVLLGAVVGYLQAYQHHKVTRQMTDALINLKHLNVTDPLPASLSDSHKLFAASYEQVAQFIEIQSQMIQKQTNDRADKDKKLLESAITQERNRLARELHDSVSQQLFAISMMMSALNEASPEDAPLKKQLLAVEEMAVQAQAEMRALLLHLRPVQLEGKKLVQGIRELLTELTSKQSMEITWHPDNISLENGVEDHLFRILQEAISNTLRHGKASRLEVRLRQLEAFSLLRIIDNGVGFDPFQRKTGSYGLGSMQERALEVGGTLKVISAPGKGTQIEVKVPITEEINDD